MRYRKTQRNTLFAAGLFLGLCCSFSMRPAGMSAASVTGSDRMTAGPEKLYSETEDISGEIPEVFKEETVRTETAVYLGIVNYGAPETNRENMDHFRYRFLICDGQSVFNGETVPEKQDEIRIPQGHEEIFRIDNGKRNTGGDYDYPIQNRLKEGYGYKITVDLRVLPDREEMPEPFVTAAEEIPDEEQPEYTPVVSGKPGVLTIKNFLRTALEPVGTVLYIFGGGWDWQDTGTAVPGRSLGVSPDWVKFFREQDTDFTFKDRDNDAANRNAASSYYPFGGYNEYYYAGLDCSGYVGWVLYNTLETEDGREGYVASACKMARNLADLGYGTWTHASPLQSGEREVKPGDVISMDGHVWISLGTCEDGSVVILHSTPSLSRTGQPGGGVQISAVGNSESCEAMQLADRYMSEHYPEWYARYPAVLRSPESYFLFQKEVSGVFSWDTDQRRFLTDPDGLQQMRPDRVLEILFSEE